MIRTSPWMAKALAVDTAEELGRALLTGRYVVASDAVRAEYGLTDTENSDPQDIVDGSDTRGCLVWATSYPEQKRFRLVPVGRGEDPRQHRQAHYRIEDLGCERHQGISSLPVAGLPLRNDDHTVRRGKRSCLIIASTEVRD